MAKVKQDTKTKQEVEVGTVVKKLPRAETVRQEILEAHKTIEVSYVDLAKLLSEAYHKEFFREWGFTDFKEYCETEVGTQYRKAMYLVDVADCVKKHGLSTAKIAKLGWTKMKDLAAVITEDNAKEWMDKAEKLSTRDLAEQVKIHRKEEGGARGAAPSLTTMKFTMGEAEANVITEAIEEAKKLLEGGDSSQQSVLALEMICQDWLEMKGTTPTRSSLSNHVKYLERVYGVKLTITKGKAKVKEVEEEPEEEEAPVKAKGKAKKEEPVKAPTKKGKKVETPPAKAKGKKKVEDDDDDDGEEGDQDINSLLGI